MVAIGSHRDQYFGHSDLAKVKKLESGPDNYYSDLITAEVKKALIKNFGYRNKKTAQTTFHFRFD